jgi:hypothetical protein
MCESEKHCSATEVLNDILNKHWWHEEKMLCMACHIKPKNHNDVGLELNLMFSDQLLCF